MMYVATQGNDSKIPPDASHLLRTGHSPLSGKYDVYIYNIQYIYIDRYIDNVLL